jgi:ABC-type glycerol-3-phosphate transport system permease component
MGPLMTHSSSLSQRVWQLAALVAKIGLLAIFLLPLLLGVAAAFRPEGEVFRFLGQVSLFTFVPAAPTLDNFRAAVERGYFVRQLLNTVAIGLMQPTLTVVIAALAAFPLARMRFPGRQALFFAMIVTLFVPVEAILVPLFLVTRDFGLLDTYGGLILPWLASPLAVFLLRQAMAEIPRDLDEAALLDGAGLLELWRTVVIPNVWPAMATVWLISFAYVWDAYLWPLVVLDNPERQVVQVGIAGLFSSQQRVRYGVVFASTVLAVVPVLVAFRYLQRFYVNNAALSGIK